MTHNRYIPLKRVPDLPGYEWTTERLLRRLVYEKRIAYTKPARQVLIDLDDLDRLVSEHRVEARGA